MSELRTTRTENHIWCGKPGMIVSGPRTEWAPQIVIIGAFGGTISVDASDVDLLIEALTTIRDAMKKAQHDRHYDRDWLRG